MVPGNSPRYKILLVDDYPPVRRMVKSLIETDPEFLVVGELGDGSALLKFLETSAAEMVILDISMPFMSGFEAARRIKERYPEVKVLILSIHNYREYRTAGPGSRGRRLPAQRGSRRRAVGRHYFPEGGPELYLLPP